MPLSVRHTTKEKVYGTSYIGRALPYILTMTLQISFVHIGHQREQIFKIPEIFIRRQSFIALHPLLGRVLITSLLLLKFTKLSAKKIVKCRGKRKELSKKESNDLSRTLGNKQDNKTSENST